MVWPAVGDAGLGVGRVVDASVVDPHPAGVVTVVKRIDKKKKKKREKNACCLNFHLLVANVLVNLAIVHLEAGVDGEARVFGIVLAQAPLACRVNIMS